jgi:hypothetical protein
MPATQEQFDGKNAVAGFTLFHGKDGLSYYLKGENLSDADVSQKVAAARAATKANMPPLPKVESSLADKALGALAPQQAPRAQGAGTMQAGMPGFEGSYASGDTDKAAVMTGAGAVAGAGLGAAALAAPTVGTATAGTGILDATGAEITKEVTTLGPSLARAGLNMAINAVKAHPYISGAIGLRLAKALGLPVEKVVKALVGMEGTPEGPQ